MPSVITPCGGGGGGGIKFNTSPQTGGYLEVKTDGSVASPSGYGMRFRDDGTVGILIEQTGTGGVIIEADAGDVSISADAGALSVTSNGGAFVAGNEGDGSAIFESEASGGSGVIIRNRSDGDMELSEEGNGSITARCFGDGSITLEVDGAGFISLVGLPLLHPGGSGRLWNNSGVVSIT